MKLNKTDNGRKLTVYLDGEIDAVSATPLEDALIKNIDGVVELVFDITKLNYISSAVLRVLLSMQKTVKNNGGTMQILHPTDEVMDVFKVTGFCRLFTITN